MKLAELVRKESERTNQEIKFDSTTASSIENKPNKIFKKERAWIEDTDPKGTFNGVETVSKGTFKQGRNGVEPTPFQHRFNTIVGKERKFLFFIINECQNNGSLSTPPLTSEMIKKAMNYSLDGLKTVIYRLTKKGILQRGEKKTGRTGWVSYKVNKEIFNEAIRAKETFNGVETVLESPLKQGLNGPNSSSIINLELNTTTIQIPEDIKTLISAKEVCEILNKGVLSEEDLQRSLEQFAYDFKNNLVKSKTGPVNLLFGLLRGGKPYRSLKMIEMENEELREYQRALAALESQNKELKEVELKNKFQIFLENNPNFIEETRKTTGENFNLSDEMLKKLAYSRWSEEKQSKTNT